MRVHFDNHTASPDLFNVSPDDYAAACQRHPDVAKVIQVSFGADGRELPVALKDAEVVVGYGFPRNLISPEATPSLKLIQVTAAGVEHLIPLTWLPEQVLVANASGAHAKKAGEYTTMALLMLNTRLPLFADNKPLRKWTREFTSSISGKTALIIGVGSMGGAAADSAARLGMRVLGVRASGEPHPSVEKMFDLSGLDEALAAAQFVVTALPSTAESRNLLSRRRLDLLPRGASLINIGRSGSVDYEALASKLTDGSLAGAVLDVFATEPLGEDSPLWDVPNLVITPHISSDDADTYMAGVLDIVFGNLRRLMLGQPLANLVDRSKGY